MKCTCGHDDKIHNNADRCLAPECDCKHYDKAEPVEVRLQCGWCGQVFSHSCADKVRGFWICGEQKF